MEIIAFGGLGGLFLLFTFMDIYVSARFDRASASGPRIETLDAMISVIRAIALGVGIGTVLGLNGIYHALSGDYFIQPPWTLIVLAVALGAPSLAVVRLLRLLRRWDAERRNAHLHSRDSEPARLHRRRDDPQP